MQLSVEMQQFAARLKQERLLQPEDDAKDFRSFFRFEAEPTTYFWQDLSDVLGRWWLGRTDTHAAVRVTAMRAVLPSEDVLVEHTQVIELQRLRKKYKKLVPRTRYNKKQNLCKVWEQDCTEAMDEEQFQRLLLPRGSALDQTAGRGDASSTVRQVPDCGALIRGCFEPADGNFFVCWLAQQVRAWRPVQDRPVQERPEQSWVYLVGQVPLLLKQILRSFCRILGDEHVVVFRHAKDHDSARKKNAELQQSLLVVVDGCSRQAHEGQRKELLKVLRSDCKVPGNEGGGRTRPINLSPWRQVLVLPEANGESLWTSDQLRQKGLAVTVARLAAPASSESLTDVPSSEELAQYLHACMLEDVALGGPARQASADGYEQWLSAFRRDVATQEKLPGLDKPLETALPHVFRVKQGKNKGRFAIRPGDLVASFERFLDLGQGKLSERAEERFWARLQESFPQLDLTKKLAHNIYACSGKVGKGAKGLLFPYTTDVFYPERDNAVEKPGARPARAAQLVFPNPNIPTDSRFGATAASPASNFFSGCCSTLPQDATAASPTLKIFSGFCSTLPQDAAAASPASKRNAGGDSPRDLYENKNSKLSNLDISLNNIGPQGAKHIAEAIQENKAVIELRMEVNKIGPAGAEAIANMLKVNLTLTALDFAETAPDHKGAIAASPASNSFSGCCIAASTASKFCSGLVRANGGRGEGEGVKRGEGNGHVTQRGGRVKGGEEGSWVE
eukprot:g3551.t1